MFIKAVVLGVGLSGAMLGEYSAFKVNISDIIFGIVQAICPINSGEYTVTNQMDADTLNMCQTFNGTLNVLSTTSTNTISVPALKNITGDLYIVGDGSLSNLTSMSYFSMQSLEFVGGTITVGPLFNLATLDLPALAAVGEQFAISENPRLSTVNLPNLTTVEALTLHELPLLADLNFVAGLKDITGYTRESLGAEIQVETSQI